jgi:GNAT superfamily N-acetyltransferase
VITFSTEPWNEIKHEILPLWHAHWLEVADPLDRERIPLDPDWDEYQASADRGILHITAARQGGVLVGYAFVFVKRGLHYKSTLMANFDLYWVDPKARGAMVGVRLFREVERAMRSRGVVKMRSARKFWLDTGPVFARCGWVDDEIGSSKWIGA